MNELKCQTYSCLDSIQDQDFRHLIRSLPDSSVILQLIEQSRFENVNFHSIVVSRDGKPVLYLPLFEIKIALSTFLGKDFHEFISKIPLLPRWLQSRMLIVGFLEGIGGDVGVDADLDSTACDDAWKLAMKSLQELSARLKTHITAFADFTPEGLNKIPADAQQEFIKITSFPYAQLRIDFSSVQDYLSSLSKATRKDLRRKIRNAKDVTIQWTQNPEPWLETIFQFYCGTVENACFSPASVSKDFFNNICAKIPDAWYVLYFWDEQLIGFNLIISKPDYLIDKYFAMDPVCGKRYSLYFISWLENIKYCIEKRIPVYHAGPTAEMTKNRLGAAFFPAFILFKHRNPLIHFMLSIFKGCFSYRYEIPVSEDVQEDVEDVLQVT